MFNEVGESLRALLEADVPVNSNEVDISFDRPTREWSSRLSRPTLNLFLSDIRERAELRDQNIAAAVVNNGAAELRRHARRIDLTYVVTAWTTEPEDEQRILAAVMACMFRHGEIPEEHLRGNLPDAEYPVLLRLMPPDHLNKPVDLWSVLDNELRASLTWVATAPLDAFAPVTAPLVRTLTTGYTEHGAGWREQLHNVAGTVHRRGEPGTPIAGARVRVSGTALEALTDAEGRFRLRAPDGDHEWLVEVEGGRPRTHRRTVPSPEGYVFEA